MNERETKKTEACPRNVIAAYLDGELGAREESALNAHFDKCADCRAELTEQKKMLCVLNFALDEKAEFEMPKNFAKVVATRAESGVNGLRDRRERPTALFLSAALFVFALVGLGAESEKFIAASLGFAEKTIAFVVTIAGFVYDLAFGTAVILRSVGLGVLGHPAIVFAPAMILAVLLFLRVINRFDRVRNFREK